MSTPIPFEVLLGQTIASVETKDGVTRIEVPCHVLTIGADGAVTLTPRTSFASEEKLDPEHPKSTSYHFDGGSSFYGPIGFCARIIAGSAEEAAERLESLLPQTLPVKSEELVGVEYIDVYFNLTHDYRPYVTDESEPVESEGEGISPVP